MQPDKSGYFHIQILNRMQIIGELFLTSLRVAVAWPKWIGMSMPPTSTNKFKSFGCNISHYYTTKYIFALLSYWLLEVEIAYPKLNREGNHWFSESLALPRWIRRCVEVDISETQVRIPELPGTKSDGKVRPDHQSGAPVPDKFRVVFSVSTLVKSNHCKYKMAGK